jgi:pyridoxine 5-phosphate synthase
MTSLSVNINKIATLRNSRGGNIPDVIEAAVRCEQFGANGITVHPRPDERHIRYADVLEIPKHITVEFNVEGNPIRSFVDLVTAVKPAQVTLVPDAHNAVTSNAGWDTVKNKSFLTEVIGEFKSHGIRVSIFVDTYLPNIEGAVKTGADRVELYTEPFASHYTVNREKAIQPFVDAANLAVQLGLGLNAGHDLNLDNLRYFRERIPQLNEVSIGHALISDALYFGMENTIQMYLRCLV